MLKISDLIKELQERKKSEGDLYLMGWKISDEDMTQEMWVNSPTRITKAGNKAKVSIKEFSKMIKEIKEGE